MAAPFLQSPSLSQAQEPSSSKKQVFKPSELREALMPTLQRLWVQKPESLPFRKPVDPVALNIPNYFDVIQRPMDLSTIMRKLQNMEYSDPWQYVGDVMLMFDNAWSFNKDSSRVYKYCDKLAQIFVQEIDPVIKRLTSCQVRPCYGKSMCSIPRYAHYIGNQKGISFCFKCFADIPGDTVSIPLSSGQATTGSQTIPKTHFVILKNDQ